MHALYLADFWNRTRCDALLPGIDLMVFDHAVNAGPDRAGRAYSALAQGLTAALLKRVIEAFVSEHGRISGGRVAVATNQSARTSGS